MKPHSIGRALGIGLRVAGRMAGQRVAEAGQARPQNVPAEFGRTAQAGTRVPRQAGTLSKGIVRGVGGFLRPFGRVGGIVWLEVTGVFFFLFALVFGTAVWRTRPSDWNGHYNRAFVASAALLLVFLYLGASSFWRARRK